MIPEPFFLPLVVIGLVVLTLALSGVARRYQQQQAARGALVQRMENAIQLVEEALAGLQDIPLRTELVRLLRRDILDRYRMIAQMAPRYPGLTVRAAQAEAAWRAVAAREPEGLVPALASDVELGRRLAQLDALIDYLTNPGLLQPLPEVERGAHVAHLSERGADLVSRYFHDRYGEALAGGAADEAKRHLRRLMESLRARGLDSAHVQGLYDAARAALDGAVQDSAGLRQTRHAS